MTNNPSWNRRLRPFYLVDAHAHAHARHTTTHTMQLFPRPLSGALQCSATAGEMRFGRGRCWGVFWNPPALASLPSPSTYLPLPTPHQTKPFPRPLSGALQCSATAVENDTETISRSLTLAPSRGTPPHPRCGGHPRTPASCSVGLCYPSWGIGCYCRGSRSPMVVAEWLWLFLAGGRVSRLGRPCGWPACVYPPARGNSGAGLHGSAYGLRFTSALAPPL